MSRPVQTEPADAGHDRRVETRHDAASLGEVTARLVGGSAVRLVNFSNRGILVESDTRLLIGARASVRITTKDASIVVTGRVVRSRVKGLVNGVLLYDAGLNLDSELSLVPAEGATTPEVTAPVAEDASSLEPMEPWDASVETSDFDLEPTFAARQSMDDEAMLQLFASVPQDLAELRRLAAANQW